jgi:hypothetical protein
MVGVPTVVVLLVSALGTLPRDEFDGHWLRQALPWLLVGVPALAAMAYALRRLSFWSLTGSAYAAQVDASVGRVS